MACAAPSTSRSSTDKFALRASVYNSYEQGYIDNIFPAGPQAGQTEEDTNWVHQWGGRVAATWLPMPNLEIQAQGMWNRTETGDNTQRPARRPHVPDGRQPA